MAKQSGMSLNEYLSYIVRKSWKDLYPKRQDRRYVRMKTGEEAGITCEPDNTTDRAYSTDTDEEDILPKDILDMFGNDETD